MSPVSIEPEESRFVGDMKEMILEKERHRFPNDTVIDSEDIVVWKVYVHQFLHFDLSMLTTGTLALLPVQGTHRDHEGQSQGGGVQRPVC